MFFLFFEKKCSSHGECTNLQNVVRTSGWVSYSQEEKSCITVHQLTEYRNATSFQKTNKNDPREKKSIFVFYRGYSFIFCGFFDRDYNSYRPLGLIFYAPCSPWEVTLYSSSFTGAITLFPCSTGAITLSSVMAVGTYNLSVSVTDSCGRSDTQSLQVLSTNDVSIFIVSTC